VEVEGALGPTFDFWRELAKLYLTRLCAILDLEKAVADGLDLPLAGEEVERLLSEAPPMNGLEYLSEGAVRRAWADVERAFLDGAAASGRGPQAFLREKNAIWNTVGRVYFHLAEQKNRPETPFAFLATYTTRLSSQGKLQHCALGQAVRERAAPARKKELLSILLPVNRAAEKSAFLKELVDSGRIFQPQPWSPDEARRFLKDVPIFEEHGISVRVPDWWRPRAPARVQVTVTLGSEASAGLGLDALLDFSVDLALDGERLSREEWQAVLAASGSLVPVKGRWVEVDRERLDELLGEWKRLEHEAEAGGVSFLHALRLLARVPEGGAAAAVAGAPQERLDDPWLDVRAGDWLARTLQELRSPEVGGAVDPGPELRTTLRPYQREGVHWLWFLHKLRLGGCLADDMGLGKTVQVIAFLLLLERERRSVKRSRPALLVIPASLLGNWRSECARFAPSLHVVVAHPSESTPGAVDGPQGGGLAAGDLEQVFGIELEREGAAGSRAADLERGAAGDDQGGTAAVARGGGKARRQGRPRAAALPASRPAVPRRPPRQGAVGAGRRAVPRQAAPAAAPRRRTSRGKSSLPAGRKDRLQALKRHFLRAISITNREYRALFGIDAAAATRKLRDLVMRSLLHQRGAKRGAHYVPSDVLKS
jgi:non-specific serine/threonine protein kinase